MSPAIPDALPTGESLEIVLEEVLAGIEAIAGSAVTEEREADKPFLPLPIPHPGAIGLGRRLANDSLRARTYRFTSSREFRDATREAARVRARAARARELFRARREGLVLAASLAVDGPTRAALEFERARLTALYLGVAAAGRSHSLDMDTALPFDEEDEYILRDEDMTLPPPAEESAPDPGDAPGVTPRAEVLASSLDEAEAILTRMRARLDGIVRRLTSPDVFEFALRRTRDEPVHLPVPDEDGYRQVHHEIHAHRRDGIHLDALRAALATAALAGAQEGGRRELAPRLAALEDAVAAFRARSRRVRFVWLPSFYSRARRRSLE